MKEIQKLLLNNFDILTSAEEEKKSGRGRSSSSACNVYGIKKLRGLILELAVRGKLVPQDSSDEPASELLKSIQAEKNKLTLEGKIKKQKPLPPITNEEKLFDLPNEWEWVRNGFLFSLRKGKIPKNLSENNIGLPYLDIDALDRGYIRRYSDDDKCPQSNESDILVVCDGSRSGLVLNGKVGIIGSTLSVIDTPIFIQPFVKLIFQYGYERLNSTMRGAAIPHLDTKNLLIETVGLPPLNEQHRILNKIDELMALCDQIESQHNNASEAHENLVKHLLNTLMCSKNSDDFSKNWNRIALHFDVFFTTESSIDVLKQTILQLAVMGKLVPQSPSDEPANQLLARIRDEKQKFITEGKIKKEKKLHIKADNESLFKLPSGWVSTYFQNLIIDGPSNGYSPKPSEKQTNYRCLTLTATTKGYFDRNFFKYVDIDKNIAERFYLKNNDLLIQRANSIDYVGMPAIYSDENDIFIYPDLIMRMKVHSGVNLRYIHLFLLSKISRDYFKSNATGTQGNMPKINQGTISNHLIYLPPLSEQNCIVEKIDELIKLCDELRSRITDVANHQKKITNALIENVIA